MSNIGEYRTKHINDVWIAELERLSGRETTKQLHDIEYIIVVRSIYNTHFSQCYSFNNNWMSNHVEDLLIDNWQFHSKKCRMESWTIYWILDNTTNHDHRTELVRLVQHSVSAVHWTSWCEYIVWPNARLSMSKISILVYFINEETSEHLSEQFSLPNIQLV